MTARRRRAAASEERTDRDGLSRMSRPRFGSTTRAWRGSRPRCCGPTKAASSCCGPTPTPVELSARRSATPSSELAAVPEGANLGLGCGNPLAFAALQAGRRGRRPRLRRRVRLLPRRAAGRARRGRVIGVDMTPEMLERARAQRGARRRRQRRVPPRRDREPAGRRRHRRHGDLELRHQPLARQAARLPRGAAGAQARRPADGLRPRARAAAARERARARSRPTSAASPARCCKDDYLAAIRDAGFADVEVLAESTYPIGSLEPDATELAILDDPTIPRDDLLRRGRGGGQRQGRRRQAVGASRTRRCGARAGGGAGPPRTDRSARRAADRRALSPARSGPARIRRS